MTIDIRLYQASDLDTLLRINEENVPAVGTVTRDHLANLLDLSPATFVAEFEGEIAGFLLSMVEGQDYSSPNYVWLCERHDAFAYIDRVAVSDDFQGKGIGVLLYAALEDHATGSRPALACEVNSQPPNPGSLRFHKRMGFVEAGEQVFEPGKKSVTYLIKPLS